MVITAKCAHCGAQIVFGETDEVTVCKYCDSVNAIPDVIKKTSEENEVKEEPKLREIMPEIKYAANHQVSASNSQGGHIWITKYELYFKPHKFNMGDLSKRYIRIQDICGYEKGLLTSLTIYTKKGYAMELAVWKKDEIINALEARRRAYFELRGEPVPELTKGDCKNIAIKESQDTGVDANVYTESTPKSGLKLWQKIAIGLFILWLIGQML